jgi:hypothetical protein
MARTRHRPRSRPEQRPSHYVVKRGRGFWQPTKRMRALGFSSVQCGRGGSKVHAIAESWNVKQDTVRRQLAQSRGQQEPTYRAITVLSWNLADKLEREFERAGRPTHDPTVPRRVPIRVQTHRRLWLPTQWLKWLGSPIRYLASAVRAVQNLAAASKQSLCGHRARFQRNGAPAAIPANKMAQLVAAGARV